MLELRTTLHTERQCLQVMHQEEYEDLWPQAGVVMVSAESILGWNSLRLTKSKERACP